MTDQDDERSAFESRQEKKLIREELSAIQAGDRANGTVRPHIGELLERLEAASDAAGSDAAESGTDGESPYLVGLALSGGGIRSATFSLGVMQRLSRAGILKHVDYLSTVSGGGYIGSALTWWLSDKSGAEEGKFGTDKENFPFSTEDPKEPATKCNHILDYLRAHGNYLVPGNGITIWSGIAVALRVILLNLLVWLPATAFLFWLLWALGTTPILNGLPYFVSALVPGALSGLVEAVGATGTESSTSIFPPAFLLMFIFTILLLFLFITSAINYSLLSWFGREDTHAATRGDERRMPRFVQWLLAGLVALLGLIILIVVGWVLWGLSADLFALKTPGPLTTMPTVLGLSLIFASAVVILLTIYIFDEQGLGGRTDAIHDWTQFRWVLIGFIVLFMLDVVFAWLSLSQDSLDWPDWLVAPSRLSLIVSFLAGLGFLAVANFLVGYTIRWILRRDDISLFYGARRLFEAFFGIAIKLACFLAVIGSVPIAYTYLKGFGGLEGVASLVIGIGATLTGQIRSLSGGNGQRPPIIYVIASMALAYGVLLIGYRWSVLFVDGDIATRALLAALAVIAFIIGWFTNINYIGFHRFYRDRLMEAFMPDWETVKSRDDLGARLAEDLRLSAVWPGPYAENSKTEQDPPKQELEAQEPTKQVRKATKDPRPFHIINTNLVLANSKNRKYRLRGGDNFILTPLKCGSDATEWVSTKRFLDDGMTLATAMAISGAAANPRTGAGGKGVTRNSFVSIAMGLLGARLGYWVRHPEAYKNGKTKKKTKRINHFYPAGCYALLGHGYRENNNYLELSDGGHFENLALYELARRRCGLIIVCDGGQDVETSYSDFVTAIQRLGQDLQARISFDMKVFDRHGKPRWQSSSPTQLIARPTGDEYPKQADYSDKGYFVATIDYGIRGGGAWPKTGTIIYLKSSMIRELEITAKGYKGAHPDFPNETTADQFFDEEQFEAYREVGYRIAGQMVDDLNLDQLFKKERPRWSQLRRNDHFSRAEE
ncbi:MAG: patatin-like phospholipase family protein [Geminicoccaceae bacterium]